MSQPTPTIIASNSPMHRPLSRFPSRMPTSWKTEISAQLKSDNKKRNCSRISILIFSILTFLAVACLATFSWLFFFGGMAATFYGVPPVTEAIVNETVTFITSLKLLENQFEVCNSSECLPSQETLDTLLNMANVSLVAPNLPQYYYTTIAAIAHMPELWNVAETEHAYAHLTEPVINFIESALDYPYLNVTQYTLELLWTELDHMQVSSVLKPFEECTPREQEIIERLRTAVEKAVNAFPTDNIVYSSYCCLITVLQIQNPSKQRLYNIVQQAENLDVMSKSLVSLGLRQNASDLFGATLPYYCKAIKKIESDLKWLPDDKRAVLTELCTDVPEPTENHLILPERTEEETNTNEETENTESNTDNTTDNTQSSVDDDELTENPADNSSDNASETVTETQSSSETSAENANAEPVADDNEKVDNSFSQSEYTQSTAESTTQGSDL